MINSLIRLLKRAKWGGVFYLRENLIIRLRLYRTFQDADYHRKTKPYPKWADRVLVCGMDGGRVVGPIDSLRVVYTWEHSFYHPEED